MIYSFVLELSFMTTITSSNNSVHSTQPARYTGNFYFEDGRWLTGILAALLYLIVATALDAAGHVASLALLIPVTLGALILGAMMAYSRFDGFFALSHGMFTGLAWILYLMGGMVKDKEIDTFLHYGVPVTQAKVYFVLYRLLTWVDAAWHNTASNDNYVFVFEISFLVWWLTYLGMWSIFRHGYTWRAVVPTGLVLVINTYYAPNSTLGFLIVFMLLALLLLVRTNLAEQQLRWRGESIYFSQDITLDFLRDGLIYSVVVLALAWIAPSLGRNIGVHSLMAPFNDRVEQTAEQVTKLYGGLTRQKQAGGSTFGRSLALGGRRNVGSSLVFTVAAPVGRYWRAVVFDTFDGRQWQNTAHDELKYDPNTQLPDGNWDLRTPITQTIKLFEPTGGVIFGAPNIRQVNIPVTTLVRAPAQANADAPPADANAVAQWREPTYLRSSQSLDAGDSYRVVSEYTAVTEQALEAASTDYPANIGKLYTQLPQNFSPKVQQTAREVTASSATVYAKAKAIEAFLRKFKYDDAIDAPPPNVDPVEYFLYTIKKGYCDYYATAMVTMLRSLGIPARTASGYAEGVYDKESGLYSVTEQDAHTWVEVYFPTYGWIEFEPTASKSALIRPHDNGAQNPAQQQNKAASNPGAPDQQNQSLVNPPKPDANDLASQNATLGERAANPRDWPWWVWALLTPTLLVVGIWGLRRSQGLGSTAFTPELPPIVYERMQRWAERLGLRMASSDTPYEQARLFGRALPEGRSLIQKITEIYVHYRFSRQTIPGSTAESTNASTEGSSVAGESWQALYPMLWRAWLRKLTNRVVGRMANPFHLRSR